MTFTLRVIVGLLLGTPAHAADFLLPAGTYAMRALCPPKGDAYSVVYAGDYASWLSISSGYCVNGRIGTTFTVQPTTIQPIHIALAYDVGMANPKLLVEPDCADDASTTCVIQETVAGSGVGTTTGRFTYPGDIDWFKLVNTGLQNISTATRKGCFATGKIIDDGLGNRYLAVIGGPSGCAYTVSAQYRAAVE
jgi:hypothetical protein